MPNKRIDQLNPNLNPLTGNELVPIFDNNSNSTERITLNELAAAIGGGGVQSVTDNGTGVVSVDNADPVNPVISFNGVNVDGITITGDGTVGSPLVANIPSLVVKYANVLWVDSTTGNDATAVQNEFTKPYLTPSAAATAATLLSPSKTNRTLIIVRRGEYTSSIILQNFTDWYCEPGVVFVDASVYDNVVSVDSKFLGKATFTGYGATLGGLIFRSNGPASKVVFEFDEIDTIGGALEVTNGSSATISGRRVYSETLDKGFACTFRQGGNITLNLSEELYSLYIGIDTRFFSGNLVVNTPRIFLGPGDPWGYGGNYKNCFVNRDNSGGRMTINADLVANNADGYYGGISGIITFWTSGNGTVILNGNIFAENQFGIYGLGSSTNAKLIVNGSITSNNLGGYISNNTTCQIKNGTIINKNTTVGSENFPVLSLSGSAKYFIDNCQMYSEQASNTYTNVSAFWKDTTAAEINVYNTVYSAVENSVGFFIRNSVGGQPVNNVRILNCRSTKPLDTNITDILTPTGFTQDSNILSINYI